MGKDVVAVLPEAAEIARLLATHPIKRAPIVPDENLIVSEALGRPARDPSS